MGERDRPTTRQQRAIDVLLCLAERRAADFGMLMADMSERQTARALEYLKSTGLIRFDASSKAWMPTGYGDSVVEHIRRNH